MPAIRSSKKRLSPARIRALKTLAEKIDRTERAEILVRGQAAFRRHAWIREVVHCLSVQRKRQKLSLSEVARRTGISKPNLSRLENNVRLAPTLDTLQRYAQAVGWTFGWNWSMPTRRSVRRATGR